MSGPKGIFIPSDAKPAVSTETEPAGGAEKIAAEGGEVDRNPIIIPEAPDRIPACPQCGSQLLRGSSMNGVLRRKCAECGNEWTTGTSRSPIDPKKPVPPDLYRAPIEHERNLKGELVEVFRRVDLTPAYRQGPIYDPDLEEDF